MKEVTDYLKEQDFTFEIMKLADLKFAEYNPRKSTPRQERKLTESIQKYGFIDFLIVNKAKNRKNIVVCGNLRLKILRELGYEQVPCVLVDIPDIKNEQELNIRHNANTAEFDPDKLPEVFDKAFLQEIGVRERYLTAFISDLDKKMNQYDNDNATYPIVAKMSEKYDYVLIVSDNEIDTAFLHNMFELETQKSYKSQRVGVGRVIRFDKLKKLAKKWKKS